MFRKLNILSIALMTTLLSTPCTAIETLVHFGSLISKAGSMTLNNARYKIIPDNWTLKSTNKSIYNMNVSWKKGVRWTSLLDVIGQRESVSFVVDGATKTVYVTNSVGILKPGVVLVNSKVKAQKKLYKIELLDELASHEEKEILNDKKVADLLQIANANSTVEKPNQNQSTEEREEEPTSTGIQSLDGDDSNEVKSIKKEGLRISKSTNVATDRLVNAFAKETSNNLYIHSDWIAENWYDHLQFKSLGKLNDLLWYDSSKSTFVFQMKAGTLRKNLESLLFNTKKTEVLDPQEILNRHQVYNDMQISGESVLHIIDKIIAPYNEPSQIRGEAHPNHVITFNYETTIGIR